MSNEIQSKLDEAFAYVEADRLEDALQVVSPILESDPENADAWWIYSYAVTDPREAYRALNNVKRLAPDYDGISEMITTFNSQYPEIVEELASDPLPAPKTPVKPALPPLPMPEAPSQRPALPQIENVPQYTRSVDEFDPAINGGKQQRSSLPLIAFIAALVVIGLVAVLLLTNNPSTTQVPTATLVTAVAENGVNTDIPSVIDTTPTTNLATDTLEITSEVTLMETSVAPSNTDVPPVAEITEVMTTVEAIPTLELVQDVTQTAEVMPEVEPNVTAEATVSEQSLSDVLSEFTLTSEGTIDVETDFGMTFIAEVCSAPGRELRTLMPLVMEAIARSNEQLPENTEAIGVRMVNCEDQTVFLAVVATVEDAQSFAEGNLDSAAFAATWRPIR